MLHAMNVSIQIPDSSIQLSIQFFSFVAVRTSGSAVKSSRASAGSIRPGHVFAPNLALDVHLW